MTGLTPPRSQDAACDVAGWYLLSGNVVSDRRPDPAATQVEWGTDGH